MLGKFRYIDISILHRFLTIDATNLFRIDRRNLSINIFFVALLVNIFASIHVMYFWPIEAYVSLLTMPLFVFSILIDRSQDKPIFTRSYFILPLLFAVLAQYYQAIANQQNLVPYFLATMSGFMYYCLFKLDINLLKVITTRICKVTACFMIVSILFFLLYILGFGLPSISISQGHYSYTNYFFFLLDDRDLWSIIPRFHSVFLEPGHMGTTLVMFLATQIGQWKKWYNIVLFVALFMSFSLAAYGLVVILFFLRLWILRRKLFLKVVMLVTFIAAIVGGSYVYNGGDNMLNQLIVMRFEMNDTGDDIEGDNRVSDDFQKEYDSFLTSSDVLLGKEMDYQTWGNSGYKVYLYDYGICGFLMFMIFYFFAFKSGTDLRAIISAFVLALVNFGIRGYPILFAFAISYFFISQINLNQPTEIKQFDEPNK